MAVTTLAECLAFVGVDSSGIFEINAANDVMVLTSDEGGPVNIDIADGTYSGAALATALASAMNANGTLTGGTITFAVTYSTSTLKFTLDATVGKTIAYTHTGSDAGTTLGFTADAAAAQTVASDTAVPGDPSDLVSTIRDDVEQDILSQNRDDFASASYVHQLYSGDGTRYLRLRNWPVTALSSIAISKRVVVQIRNTSQDTTTALVDVDVTAKTLTLTRKTALITSSTSIGLTGASSDTIAELISTINDEGDGWDAIIGDSRFADMFSTELLEVKGLNVADIEDSGSPPYEDLLAPDPLTQVDVNEDTGMMYLPGGWPVGNRNVIVSYTGGFSTIPGDLKGTVLRMVKMIYDKVQERADGIKTLSLGGGVSMAYLDELPKDMQKTLDFYKDTWL